ncbi:MAG: type II secretion system protein GspM [Thermodesulfobacteriota bacterium]|nr:type II secretion system protein GspM [Thermodesulfobacteriota bacterium]
MIANLSPREQVMLLIGTLCCLITLLYFAMIQPYTTAIAKLDSKIASRSKQLHQVKQLQQEYRHLQGQVQSLQKKQNNLPDFALFSFVESQVTRIAGRENLTSMRPLPAASHNDIVEEAVEIKLENISLAQIVQLLQSFDIAPASLQVKTLQLKVRYDNPDRLNSSLRISAYSKHQQ